MGIFVFAINISVKIYMKNFLQTLFDATAKALGSTQQSTPVSVQQQPKTESCSFNKLMEDPKKLSEVRKTYLN
jgi:hypothetical protein